MKKEQTESTGATWVMQMGVGCTLKYNGISVADGGVGVGIGHKGKIASIKATWRNVKPGRIVQITISPEEAIKNLGEHIPPTSCPFIKIKKMIINKVELAYCQDSIKTGEPLNELQVVYLLDTLIIKEDGTQHKTYFWAPATDE